jgi:hypothetical protein
VPVNLIRREGERVRERTQRKKIKHQAKDDVQRIVAGEKEKKVAERIKKESRGQKGRETDRRDRRRRGI